MNEQTKAIIKSTAPVLKEHGEAISTANMHLNISIKTHIRRRTLRL